MTAEADRPDVLHDRALAAIAADRDEEAVGLLLRVLALSPRSATALLNLGLALSRLGRFAQAEAVYAQACLAAPDRAQAWAGRAEALRGLGRPGAAIDSARQALALDPACVDALIAKGLAERETNQPQASIASLSAALTLQPDNAVAMSNLGVSELTAGELPAGFRHHEARWRVEPGLSETRAFDPPLWLGETDLSTKTLLLHAEQGFGDTIQFCRYAALAKAAGGRVVLEVQPALKALMASLSGVDALVARGEPLPRFDLHCPLMSLPLAFGTTIETIPARDAYLAAPVERLAAWADLVPQTDALKVGLAWFGKPTHRNDRNRSLKLAQLMRALPPGLALHSLHDRARPEDADTLAAHPEIHRFEDRLADFVDTAALAAQMDVVVAVDTSAAHLAAAIGRPTIVLLPFAPDWRWLLGRDDSPWYPSVHLIRQPALGDWDGALELLRLALEAMKRR